MNKKREKVKKKEELEAYCSPDEKAWGLEVLLNLPGRKKEAEIESRGFSKVNLKKPGDLRTREESGRKRLEDDSEVSEGQQAVVEMQSHLLTSQIRGQME